MFVITGGVDHPVGTFAANEVQIAGMVPDGVTSVTLHMQDGTTHELPVADNGVFADIVGATASLTFTDASGAAHAIDVTAGGTGS